LDLYTPKDAENNVETPTTLKLNPVNAVHAKPKATYGPKKAVILEAGNLSLVGATLSQDYLLGGHLDADPLNTAFSPVSEHPDTDISGAKIEQTLFIGHFPSLKAKAEDVAVSTHVVNSKFVLVEGSGYRFNVKPSIAAEPTAYDAAAVGQGPNLKGADLQQANLAGTDFSGCNLEGANFAGANLKGCNFTCTNLTKANFAEADLSDAKLLGANLDSADCSGTITSDGTDFSYAYLVGAMFATLSGSVQKYFGCFKGTVFKEGDRRLDVANASFKTVTGLVDDQFACYYKADVTVPPDVKADTLNKYSASRTAS
jgi:uncharacterized protein YjbI with pentapeptide repeats